MKLIAQAILVALLLLSRAGADSVNLVSLPEVRCYLFPGDWVKNMTAGNSDDPLQSLRALADGDKHKSALCYSYQPSWTGLRIDYANHNDSAVAANRSLGLFYDLAKPRPVERIVLYALKRGTTCDLAQVACYGSNDDIAYHQVALVSGQQLPAAVDRVLSVELKTGGESWRFLRLIAWTYHTLDLTEVEIWGAAK